MADNRAQVRIAHLTKCAFSERAGRDGEVVHVGNALRCGFGIVAADTGPGVGLSAECLLIAESNFLYRDLDTLSRCIAKPTSPQVHFKDEERVTTYLEVFFSAAQVAIELLAIAPADGCDDHLDLDNACWDNFTRANWPHVGQN